jgi:uncharacterized protein
MKKPLTNNQIAEMILKESNEPLRALNIWEKANVKFGKDISSTARTLQASLCNSIRDNPERTPFFSTYDIEGYVVYGLKGRHAMFLHDETKDTIEVTLDDDLKMKEKDLHKYLTYHQYNHNNETYTKTIRHEKSNKGKKGSNIWDHSDIFGVQFKLFDLDPNLAIISEKLSSDDLIKFISYEMKLKLNFSNFKKLFFQALSNSSWANEGYLVAKEIETDEEFRKELQELSTEYGIGIIELNEENPDNSSVLFPAKTKQAINTSRVNKLIEINADIKGFFKTIVESLIIKRPLKDSFDKVLNLEDLKIKDEK